MQVKILALAAVAATAAVVTAVPNGKPLYLQSACSEWKASHLVQS